MGDDWRKQLRTADGGLVHPGSPQGGGGPGDFDVEFLDGGHTGKVPGAGSSEAQWFDWSALPFLDLDDRLHAVLEATERAQRHAGAAIYEATGEELSVVLHSVLPGILFFLKVLGISTGVGALAGGALGALAGGVGLAPGALAGAAVGLQAGLVAMQYLGIAFLASYVVESLADATTLAKDAVLRAWRSPDRPDTQPEEIETAGRELAQALALVMRGVLQGVAAYVMARGGQLAAARVVEVAAKLRTSRLGAGFATWVEQHGLALAQNPRLAPGAATAQPPRVGATRGGGGGEAKGGGNAPAQSSAGKPVPPEKPASSPQTKGAASQESATPANAAGGDRNRVSREQTTNTGHPVDVATGKVFTDTTDVDLPGVLGLCWQRVWYSTSRHVGPLGHGWHHSYDAALMLRPERVQYRTRDGRNVDFPALSPGHSHFDATEKLTLLRDGGGGYSVRTQDRQLWHFGPAGTRDDVHRLLAIEDPAGRRVSLCYDAVGRLIALTDGAGRTIQLELDSLGRIRALTAPHPDDPDRVVSLVHYRYDARGDLVEARDALDQAYVYRYARHLLVQETDPNGLSFHFEYDPQDRCVRTFGDGGLYDHKLSYDAARNATTVEDSLGYKTRYEHHRGLVTRTVDALGGVTTVEYDAHDNLLARIDALGQRTHYGYDARGNCTEWNTPDGARFLADYDASDRLLGISLGDIRQLTLAYDERGRVVARTDALGAVTRFEYEGADPCAVIDPGGHRTRLAHDARGNLTRITAPTGATTLLQYDALGRLRMRTDARGNAQTRSLDLLGRVRRVHEPDGNIRTLEYDARGNPTRITDRHRDIQLTYRGLDKLSTRSEAGTLLVFEYDTEERLRTVLNEQGEAHRFERGPTGEVETEIGFGGRRRSYRRDLLGRVTHLQRGSGHSSRYVYDPMHRIREVHHSDGDIECYGYRADGALLSATNDAIDVHFTRDALGRVLRETQGPHTVTSQYDGRGLRTRLQSSLGADVHIERDPLGAARTIASDDWQAIFQRDALGVELERQLPGHVSSRWQRNRLGRASRHDVVAAERTLRSRSYRWDVDRRLLELLDIDHGHTQFEYDDRGRLSRARSSDGTHELRTPDAIGNLFRSRDRSDRSYGPAGELLQLRERGRTTRYSYDADGNLAEKREPSGRTWRYRWNAAGRLRSVLRPDGSEVRFDYDAFGRRVRKHYRGQTTHFVWDGHVPLHEWVAGTLQPLQPGAAGPELPVDSAIKQREADLQSALAQGPPLRGSADAPITWLFEPESFRPMAKFVGHERHAILTDTLGAPLLMTDAQGRATWSASLNTYGRLHHLEGSAQACPFRLQGQYEDLETGLHYNGHRYYDPDCGRYISQDPLGLAGGLSLYAYCSDPLRYIDPLGLSETPCNGGAPGAEQPIVWPPNRGFHGDPGRATLVPGTVVDRYGAPSGTFVSPQGTPFPARALPAQAASRPLNAYQVVKPIEADVGPAAPWFDQPGMGMQYELSAPVQTLIDSGHLRPIPGG